MYFTVIILAVFLGQALAGSGDVCFDGPSRRLCGDKKAKRATCNHDNLLRSFHDSRYSSSASSFCSSYIEKTTTVQSTAITTITVTPLQKRDLSSTNTVFNGVTSYGSSRLSSACSCIITAPLTVTTTAVVSSTVTVQASYGTCGLGPGYSDGDGVDHFIGFLGNDGSLSGCKAACATYPRCKAFAAAPGECYGYSDIVANDLVSIDDTSPYYFYDLTCQF